MMIPERRTDRARRSQTETETAAAFLRRENRFSSAAAARASTQAIAGSPGATHDGIGAIVASSNRGGGNVLAGDFVDEQVALAAVSGVLVALVLVGGGRSSLPIFLFIESESPNHLVDRHALDTRRACRRRDVSIVRL